MYTKLSSTGQLVSRQSHIGDKEKEYLSFGGGQFGKSFVQTLITKVHVFVEDVCFFFALKETNNIIPGCQFSNLMNFLCWSKFSIPDHFRFQGGQQKHDTHRDKWPEDNHVPTVHGTNDSVEPKSKSHKTLSFTSPELCKLQLPWKITFPILICIIFSRYWIMLFLSLVLEV